jgi:hypothetical protein
MHQIWHDLLFAHWRVPVQALRRLIPPSLEIDTFDGQAYIAVVPFRMSGVRPRYLPSVPKLSAFPELNVRTYVIKDGKPGVWFFSLDAGNRFAVEIARRWFHLPYFHAAMQCQQWQNEGIAYTSTRIHPQAPSANLRVQYAPTSPIFSAQPGSLEYFLTARYCLYATDKHGKVFRGEIDHPDWALQLAQAEIAENNMTHWLAIDLPRPPDLLHFVRRIEVVVWGLRPV